MEFNYNKIVTHATCEVCFNSSLLFFLAQQMVMSKSNVVI